MIPLLVSQTNGIGMLLVFSDKCHLPGGDRHPFYLPFHRLCKVRAPLQAHLFFFVLCWSAFQGHPKMDPELFDINPIYIREVCIAHHRSMLCEGGHVRLLPCRRPFYHSVRGQDLTTCELRSIPAQRRDCRLERGLAWARVWSLLDRPSRSPSSALSPFFGGGFPY